MSVLPETSELNEPIMATTPLLIWCSAFNNPCCLLARVSFTMGMRVVFGSRVGLALISSIANLKLKQAEKRRQRWHDNNKQIAKYEEKAHTNV